MDKQNTLESLHDKLATWLDDVKEHEVTEIVELVETFKRYLTAAEEIPENSVKQFIDHFKADLVDFYHLNQQQAKESIYFGLMSETLWAALADVTDKSQVEWSELVDDFEHDGDYEAGQLIGFGILSCKQCQDRRTYHHLSEIVPCPECNNTHFRRIPFAP